MHFLNILQLLNKVRLIGLALEVVLGIDVRDIASVVDGTSRHDGWSFDCVFEVDGLFCFVFEDGGDAGLL